MAATLERQIYEAIRGKCVSDAAAESAAAKAAELAVEKFTSTNSAMDAIPTLFNKWLLTICQSESDCNVVKSFLRWAQEQHQ